uniref:Uncharacterized protein n=1 Tax=Utricularia reniformis TaxID=192314 RepID=A0A1Y0B0X4_9LAMI|nr:hypothetical protein AEK19_MT0795 [Utricularia reniformis]ART31034.1 hypothetical protein AEK19_MT0795 [Utricularia reniformis]
MCLPMDHHEIHHLGECVLDFNLFASTVKWKVWVCRCPAIRLLGRHFPNRRK